MSLFKWYWRYCVKNSCQQHKDGNVRLILVVCTMWTWHWQGNTGDLLLLLAQPTERSDLKSYSKHIHPSSTPASSCSQGRRDLESVPAVIGWQQGYTPDKSAVHHRAKVKDKTKTKSSQSASHASNSSQKGNPGTGITPRTFLLCGGSECCESNYSMSTGLDVSKLRGAVTRF